MSGMLQSLACLAACMASAQTLVDKDASEEARALYRSLLDVMEQKKGTMFGHQDDLLSFYSRDPVAGKALANPPESDVFTATGGRFYPKVFGCDVGNIWKDWGPYKGRNVDGLYTADIKQYVQKAHSMGGVVTMTMHNDNPLTGGHYWDPAPGTVKSILKGGAKHSFYLEKVLAPIADFIESVAPAPILLRPYHEATMHDFWWGFNSGCSREEYTELWNMTVRYFMGRPSWKHNVLFVISPQDITMVNSGHTSDPHEYFSRYPGDHLVDVLGLDTYALESIPAVQQVAKTLAALFNLQKQRKQHKQQVKPVALTEAGKMHPDRTHHLYEPRVWWTGTVGWIINWVQTNTMYSPAWALVWRNRKYTYNFTTQHWQWSSQSAQCFVPASPTARGSAFANGDCEPADFLHFLENKSGLVQFLPFTAPRRLQDSPLLV